MCVLMHVKLSLDPAILKGNYDDCHSFLVREESKVREKLRPLLQRTLKPAFTWQLGSSYEDSQDVSGSWQ